MYIIFIPILGLCNCSFDTIHNLKPKTNDSIAEDSDVFPKLAIANNLSSSDDFKDIQKMNYIYNQNTDQNIVLDPSIAEFLDAKIPSELPILDLNDDFFDLEKGLSRESTQNSGPLITSRSKYSESSEILYSNNLESKKEALNSVVNQTNYRVINLESNGPEIKQLACEQIISTHKIGKQHLQFTLCKYLYGLRVSDPSSNSGLSSHLSDLRSLNTKLDSLSKQILPENTEFQRNDQIAVSGNVSAPLKGDLFCFPNKFLSLNTVSPPPSNNPSSSIAISSSSQNKQSLSDHDSAFSQNGNKGSFLVQSQIPAKKIKYSSDTVFVTPKYKKPSPQEKIVSENNQEPSCLNQNSLTANSSIFTLNSGKLKDKSAIRHIYSKNMQKDVLTMFFTCSKYFFNTETNIGSFLKNSSLNIMYDKTPTSNIPSKYRNKKYFENIFAHFWKLLQRCASKILEKNSKKICPETKLLKFIVSSSYIVSKILEHNMRGLLVLDNNKNYTYKWCQNCSHCNVFDFLDIYKNNLTINPQPQPIINGFVAENHLIFKAILIQAVYKTLNPQLNPDSNSLFIICLENLQIKKSVFKAVHAMIQPNIFYLTDKKSLVYENGFDQSDKEAINTIFRTLIKPINYEKNAV